MNFRLGGEERRGRMVKDRELNQSQQLWSRPGSAPIGLCSLTRMA